MTEPTVSLCGSCLAIAPSSAWDALTVESHPIPPDGHTATARLVSCPACGLAYVADDPEAGRYIGSWPAMIRKRLDLRAGAA